MENIFLKGTKVLDIVKKYQGELPYTILLATVNNQYESLNFVLTEDSKVELLDMRNQAANLVYQRSLTIMYLNAVAHTLGNVPVHVGNSLCKGLFTIIKKKDMVTSEEIKVIEERMLELVGENIPIESMAEAKTFLYGKTVPTTGYLKNFQLVRYRKGIILRFPYQSKPDEIPPFREEEKLYHAFATAKNVEDLMGITYITDLNRKIDNGEYKEIIQISEAVHEKHIAQIADRITQEKKRIILIAGPSSSGKTTFAKRLNIQLKVNGLNPIYLSTDDYFVERTETPLDENGKPNFEDIEAIDVNLFNDNLNGLLGNQEVDLPTFDFISGSKVFGQRKTKATRNQPLVIEGIHGLNKHLTDHVPDEEKFKIYISPLTQLNIDSHNRIPTTDARKFRRMVRDYKFRGHSARNTIDEWAQVRAGEDKNIFPFNDEADVFFNSVHIYELAVLKKYAEPLLEEIKREQPEYAEARRMLEFLSFFHVIEDDSVIVNNSIMREFIGGSIFV